MEYASNGKGNLGVTLGAIGTGLGALGTNVLPNLLGGGNTSVVTKGSDYVTKEMLDLQLQLVDCKKDNAILSADLSSEKKMVEVFNAANDKIMAVRDELGRELRRVEKQIDENAAAQAIVNTQNYANVSVLQNQMTQLFGLTKLGIPNNSLCPGYGNVCITPTGCGTICGTTTA